MKRKRNKIISSIKFGTPTKIPSKATVEIPIKKL
jgi:hypothetical protein